MITNTSLKETGKIYCGKEEPAQGQQAKVKHPDGSNMDMLSCKTETLLAVPGRNKNTSHRVVSAAKSLQ